MESRYHRILVTGAAGSGKTTLGAALAAQLGADHLEAEDFMWLPTEPPFVTRRDPAERDLLFQQAVAGARQFVLSGTLLRWSDAFIHLFDLAVFLRLTQAVRLARLEARERRRYSDKIEPGGVQHLSHETFVTLARGYESGEAPVNNLANDRQWLSGLSCPVIEIGGEPSPDESLAIVLNACRTV